MMKNPLDEHNICSDSLKGYFQSIKKEDPSNFRKVRFNAAIGRYEGQEINILSAIWLLPENSNNNEYTQQILDYQNIMIVKKFYEFEELFTIIDNIEHNKLVFEGHHIPLEFNHSKWQKRTLPSNNEFWAYPTELYKIDSANKPPINDQCLLEYNLPFYKSARNAISECFGIKTIKNWNDYFRGSIIILAPHVNIFFKKIKIRKNVIEIAIANSPSKKVDLKIKGSYSNNELTHIIDYKIENSELCFEIFPDTKEIEFWLIDSSNYIYDFHKESKQWSYGNTRLLLNELNENNALTALKEALESCEGPMIEFKPFIKPDDKKFNELANTASAFLNLKGGSIFLGIDDHASVIGIDKELSIFARKSNIAFEERYDYYIGKIKKLFSDSFSDEAKISYQYIEYKGKIVIMISIPEGERKPYQLLPQKEFLIRRGANNFKADKKDLESLYEMSNIQPPTLW